MKDVLKQSGGVVKLGLGTLERLIAERAVERRHRV